MAPTQNSPERPAPGGLALAMVGATFRLVAALLSHQGAVALYRKETARMLALTRDLDDAAWRRRVRVPAMPGVDEGMRDWSPGMIARHCCMVNAALFDLLQAMAQGGLPQGGPNPRTDFEPRPADGREQASRLDAQARAFGSALDGMSLPRGGMRRRHPVFGSLDPHGWLCVLAVHLRLHRRQLAVAVRLGQGKQVDRLKRSR